MKNYVNLHTHTIGSFLDGHGKPDIYFERAAKLGMPGLGITDHGNLHMLLDWYEAGTAVGVKPILGIEAYQARKSRLDRDPEERAGPARDEWQQRGPYHLTVLAKNMAGYKNLIKLSSRGYTEGFFAKSRIDHELLSEHSGGIIVLSGCLNGEVAQALLREDMEAAVKAAMTMQDIVGKENYFIEVMDHGIEEQIKVMPGLIEIAKKIGAPIVPTGDCHYVHKQDHDSHDLMLCVSTGSTVDTLDRFKFCGPEFYLKSYDEMLKRFKPEWLENSLKICDMVDLDLKFGELFFPSFPDVPKEESVDDYLERLVWDGARERYGSALSDEIKDRVNYELGVVQRMGFQEYFLVVSDLITWGKSQGIRFGPGRGSAAGSILSYCLRITNLDPLKFGLLFERFLVEGRKSMPDIDIDVDDRYRDVIIGYVRDKYGEEMVAHICTFCLGVGTKVLKSDMTWVPVETLLPGDQLMGFDEEGHGGSGRKWRSSFVVANEKKILDSYRINTDQGSVVASSAHRWLTREDKKITKWERTDELKVGSSILWFTKPWETETSYEAGWLAGMLDGEGFFDDWTVGVAQNEGLLLDSLRHSLKSFDFDFKEYETDHKCKQLKVRGGLPEVARIMGSIRPLRLSEKFKNIWDGKRIYGKRSSKAKVVSIEFLGQQEVWAIETTTKTLIAEGFLSHNSTVGARSAIRDATRALGFDYLTGDALAKMIPPPVLGVSKNLEDSLKESPDLAKAYETSEESRTILDGAKGLEGVYRQPGIHAAGVVIGKTAITDYAPVMQKGEGAPVVVQWDMYKTEMVGLLKIDFLGLRNLGVIDLCVKNVLDKRGIEVDVDNIDLEDEETYANLRQGNSMGCFQIESAGMKAMMLGLKPSNIGDIMALISLYRPGPMGSGMDRDFINRKHGKEKVSYYHPALEEVLKGTYGIMLYQEDVLNVIKTLAGWDVGEADDLRKVIGKKLMDKVKSYKPKFIADCKKTHNVPATLADHIFKRIEYFAGYGFNKAHAASYAIISYTTAYLKTHYPAEYMAALMTSVASDKERLPLYLNECRRIGLTVKGPSISNSSSDFSVHDNNLLFGLCGINGVGVSIIDAIVKVREEPYTNMFDFMRRCDGSVLNKGTIENLTRGGAFDELIEHEVPQITRESKIELLEVEKTQLGTYVTDHPLLSVWPFLQNNVTCEISELETLSIGQEITLGGILTKVDAKPTKAGKKMYRLTLEDLTGEIMILIFPREAEKVTQEFTVGDICYVTGQLNNDGDEENPTYKMFYNGCEKIDSDYLYGGTPILLKAQKKLSAIQLTQLSDIINSAAGDSPVYLTFPEGNHKVTLKFKKKTKADHQLLLEQILTIGSIEV